MKRRNVLKDDEAVSPVIATILMVAITVVLAATLYMMLPGAEETEQQLYGEGTITQRSRSEGYVRIGITGLSPSSFDIEEVNVRLYNPNDVNVASLQGVQEMDFNADHYRLSWTRIEDNTVDSTSRLHIEYEEGEGDWDDGYDFDGYEVEITTTGTSGAINIEL